MTLHSLYRLEARGLLDCPIIGVAADDWSIDRLRKHAHESIEATGQTIDDAVFERFAARLSYRSEEHTSELQSHVNLVCRLLLEKKKKYVRAPRAGNTQNEVPKATMKYAMPQPAVG